MSERRLLKEAQLRLEQFSQITKCAVCSETALILAKGVRDLNELLEIGEMFVEKLEKGSLQEAVKTAENVNPRKPKPNPPQEEQPVTLFLTPREVIRLMTPSFRDLVEIAKLFPTPRGFFLLTFPKREGEARSLG